MCNKILLYRSEAKQAKRRWKAEATGINRKLLQRCEQTEPKDRRQNVRSRKRQERNRLWLGKGEREEGEKKKYIYKHDS